MFIELKYAAYGVMGTGVDTVRLKPPPQLWHVITCCVMPDGVFLIKVRTSEHVQLFSITVGAGVDLAVLKQSLRHLYTVKPMVTGRIEVGYQEQVFTVYIQSTSQSFPLY